ncbi:tRNA pseudouridine(55) synthase TruB [Alphaproteobacteria bacterium]|nr:tRNA pseudouridine(55) synthase TruB [Alphaproteobacteria bacterium]
MQQDLKNIKSGWIIVNKEVGMTSAMVVNKIKRVLKVKKAGHAGTLDPLASGVLPIALGEATKTMSFAMNSNKSYEFDIKWGAATDTDDLEGKIVAESNIRPLKNDIINVLPKFTGIIKQKPPAYSAIKINGVRSYKLARNSIISDIPEREVYIKEISLVKYINKDSARLKIECGKGVYVRSLARDMARVLNTHGHVVYLNRLSVGPFFHKDSILLADIANLVDKATISKAIKPISFVLDDIPAIDITSDEAILISRGQKVLLEDLVLEEGTYNKEVYITSNNAPIALARVENKYIHPFRVFNN